MSHFRPSLAARWLILGLLALQTGVMPVGLLACACGSEAGSCGIVATGAIDGSADCCCGSAAPACCHVGELPAASCCSLATEPLSCGLLSQCACCAAPAGPTNSTSPPRPVAEKEVAAADVIPLLGQLPPVAPVGSTRLREPLFGPPSRGPSVQIAFCIWRN